MTDRRCHAVSPDLNGVLTLEGDSPLVRPHVEPVSDTVVLAMTHRKHPHAMALIWMTFFLIPAHLNGCLCSDSMLSKQI